MAGGLSHDCWPLSEVQLYCFLSVMETLSLKNCIGQQVYCLYFTIFLLLNITWLYHSKQVFPFTYFCLPL